MCAVVILRIMNALFSGLISAIVSVAVSAIVSKWLYDRRKHDEARQMKMQLLQQIMGYRHGATLQASDSTRERFVAALNQVFPVFYGSQDVMVAIRLFRENPGETPKRVVELVRAMMKDLKMDPAPLDDDFFLTPLTPGPRPSITATGAGRS
jgi:hypothetical protein